MQLESLGGLIPLVTQGCVGKNFSAIRKKQNLNQKPVPGKTQQAGCNMCCNCNNCETKLDGFRTEAQSHDDDRKQDDDQSQHDDNDLLSSFEVGGYPLQTPGQNYLFANHNTFARVIGHDELRDEGLPRASLEFVNAAKTFYKFCVPGVQMDDGRDENESEEITNSWPPPEDQPLFKFSEKAHCVMRVDLPIQSIESPQRSESVYVCNCFKCIAMDSEKLLCNVESMMQILESTLSWSIDSINNAIQNVMHGTLQMMTVCDTSSPIQSLRCIHIDAVKELLSINAACLREVNVDTRLFDDTRYFRSASEGHLHAAFL
jgi:hypothetical protein